MHRDHCDREEEVIQECKGNIYLPIELYTVTRSYTELVFSMVCRNHCSINPIHPEGGWI